MDEKVLKGVTGFIGALTLLVCISLYYFPNVHAYSVASKEAKANAELQFGQVQVIQKIEVADEETDAQIKLELPKDLVREDVSLENDYLNQKISIRIPNGIADYFSEYGFVGSSDHIAETNYYVKDGFGVIELYLDKLYELDAKFGTGFLYLDFLNTHDVYDKVIVVDAGHGGRAVGAVKQGVEEKTVDLELVHALDDYMKSHMSEKIGVYYTRLDDSNPTLEQRVQLANKADADLFISIHNNSSSSGKMSSLNGTQVMYSESYAGEHTSERFAEICLDNVCQTTGNERIGLMRGDSIYIIRNSIAPVALIEVGFMTNADDLANLQDRAYQDKVAEGIFKAIQQAFAEGY